MAYLLPLLLQRVRTAEGVDLIYLPEKVFDIDHFMERVKSIVSKGRSMVISI